MVSLTCLGVEGKRNGPHSGVEVAEQGARISLPPKMQNLLEREILYHVQKYQQLFEQVK